LLLGTGALVAAAATDHRGVAFSLNAPVSAPLTAFGPGHTACEGQIEPLLAFGSIVAYLSTDALPGSPVSVRVTDSATHTLVAVGATTPVFPPAKTTVTRIPLSATIPAGRPVTVCFRNLGSHLLALIGSSPVDPGILLTVDGRATGQEAALTFLRPRAPSLLSLIPTVIDRAALFRPRWVGPWTFWLLVVGLAGIAVLGPLAVRYAARSDRRSSEQTTAQ
jgi:hypothetical protein